MESLTTPRHRNGVQLHLLASWHGHGHVFKSFLAQFTCSSQDLGKATSKPQLGLAISLPLLICV